MKTKFKTMCAAAVLLASVVGTAHAEQKADSIDVYYVPLEFVFDGEQYNPPEDQKSFIYDGSTYVPLRFISYSLNKAVRWNGDTYTVQVENPKDSDKLEIQDFNMNTKVRNAVKRDKFDASQLTPSQITVYKEKVNFVFDGQDKTGDASLSGLFVDNRLYVPLRFFSESVGRKIEWNPTTYTISATMPAPLTTDATTTSDKKPETQPTETPVPSPSGGGGFVGGGGGGGGSYSGGSSVPVSGGNTSSSVQADAEAKLRALETSCKNKLTPLADQYFAETDKAKKAQLISQGYSILNDCQSQFDQILSGIQGQVSADVIQTYRNRFDQAQADAMAELLKRKK